ncbi:hypothetical protein CPB86DRAFT_802433, partial [Serendipita vermifera]
MSRTPKNDRFQALDSALVVTKAVQGTLGIDPVSSPIKAATTALITVLETIRSLNECTPPHSTALVIMANRYEVGRVDRYLKHGTNKEDITHLASDVDSCWKEFMIHEAMNRTEAAVNRTERVVNRTEGTVNRTEGAMNRTEEGVNHL